MISFLFTDIEGSTQLWEQHPRAMRSALARHDRLLRACVEAHDGRVFKTTGDGLHASFARTADALAAALAGQRALQAENWQATGPLRARMAIHSGSAEQRDGDYFGPALNRTARLMTAGHGGQILISGTAANQARGGLPADTELRSMGVHRLKDLGAPEHIFQLTAPDLPATFPALRTLTKPRRSIPAPPTPLVGRELALAAVRDRLRQAGVRLLTLTGPGGIGKTRLALQVATELRDDFADGVCFVSLAAIRDPSLVIPSIAQALGLREAGTCSLQERLQNDLRDKQILLLLDNFEQVIVAAPDIAALLAACSQIVALITSRQALHLRGEKEFPVPPLALPPTTDDQRLTSDDAPGTVVGGRSSVIARSAAVQLFIARARDARPDFAINSANAPAIAMICARLDGLPLAIELAAARAKLLAAPALLAALEHRLPILTGGARDLPDRQQTLRTTIAWSYDLLSADEQALFRRLGVFVGGCTLAAAEAIASKSKIENDELRKTPRDHAIHNFQFSILNSMEALIDKSLLQRQDEMDGEPRFTMLETIGEYALEQLAEHGELDQLRRRHAAWCLALAQAAGPELTGPCQQKWLGRLEREHGNLCAAIQSALDQHDCATALALCAALWKFWQFHSHFSIGRRWMASALEQSSRTRSSLRAEVLCGAGWLAFSAGDNPAAQALFDESLALARELRDRYTIAMALHGAGQLAQTRGEYAQARALYQESLALFRDLADNQEIAWSLHHLGKLAREQGDNDGAMALFEECLALFRTLGHAWGIALALRHRGYTAYLQGDLALAMTCYQEALGLSQDIGDMTNSMWTIGCLGDMAAAQGDFTRAASLFAKSLELAQQLVDREGISWCFAGLVALAGQRSGEPCAQFLGAVQALLDRLEVRLEAAEQADWERQVAAGRAQLDAAAFARAWGAGLSMAVEQVVSAGRPMSGPYISVRLIPPPP
jgi:predicted ATPase/class 3 adenylate cyclase